MQVRFIHVRRPFVSVNKVQKSFLHIVPCTRTLMLNCADSSGSVMYE